MKNVHLSFLLLFLVLFLVSLTATVYCLFTEEEQAPGPALVARPAVVDFGVVGEGSQSTTITLTNVSRKTMTIVEPFASCTCTNVSVPKGEIKPGGSVDLKCSLDTRDRKGKTRGQVGILYGGTGEDESSKFVLSVDILAEIRETDSVELPILAPRQ